MLNILPKCSNKRKLGSQSQHSSVGQELSHSKGMTSQNLKELLTKKTGLKILLEILLPLQAVQYILAPNFRTTHHNKI